MPDSAPLRPAPPRLSMMALVATALVVLGQGVSLGQGLTRSVQRHIDTADIGRSRVGVIIREVGASVPMVSIDPDGSYIPASNMKLLTSGAALSVLGPDFVFRTEIALAGDLVIVRGSGDPALADPEILRNTEPRMTVEDLLDRLAQAVADRRPDGVEGIVVDDRVFDREFVHPTWDPNDLNKWYAPEVAGLNFHGNLLAVFASPARAGPGHTPSISLQPRSAWISVDNRARTVGDGGNTYWASREPTANRFRVFGDVRTAPPTPMNTPTHDNPLLFGRLLAERLMAKGVPVGGQTRPSLSPPASVRSAALDESLPRGELCAVVTTPLQEVLNRCNTSSINLYAEALLKRIGHEVTREPGTWANGASVLRMTIEERLGPGAALSTVVVDGSGLSHENRVAPSTLADWIESYITDPELRGPFLLSLATPGRGTFTRRFRDTELTSTVAGKSGVLTGVRALSGVAIAPDGREFLYVVLANDVPADKGPNATRLGQRIVEALDAYIAEHASAPQFGG
jgi:serine-type D-Ala-D-Ala carboxypeptidase/endopeptidase (penicillin-binding protein 4)